jgi:hypothetical protein
MKGVRTSRRDAALVVACAEAHGVSARTVREWRLKDDPRWNTYLVSRARSSELELGPSRDPLSITPADEEADALRRYDSIQRICDAAIERKDTHSLPQLLKSAHEAHRLLEQVRQSRLSYEEATGKLVNRDAFREQIGRVFDDLRIRIGNVPVEVNHLCNPTDPETPMVVLEEWANRILHLIPDPHSYFNSNTATG